MEDIVDLKIKDFVKRASIPKLEVLVWNDGKVFKSSYGVNEISSADVFEIGSVGKTFTSALLAVLVKSGFIKLEDKVSKYKPELPFASEITLKNLATHLECNPIKFNWFSNKKNIEKITSFKKSDLDAYLSEIKNPLKLGKLRYSNIGMALLGNILSEKLGCTYEDAVKKHVLRPLKMFDTHISSNVYEKSRINISFDSQNRPVVPFLWEGMEPAGVWRSTTSDMMLFLKAHLGYFGEYWKDTLSDTTNEAFENPKLDNIGLAWFISQSKFDSIGRYSWHNGATFGQKSMAIVSKEKNKAAILLSNKAPKLWHMFLPSYSLEVLAEDILA